MKRIFIPTDGPETWKQFLANPDIQWRLGFSAMSTAYSWENANGLPNEIAAVLKSADETAIRDAKLAIALPEYKVRLAGGIRPSQNDVFALLTCPGGLISMMVEGKAREDFDATLGDWKKRTSPQGIRERLADIMDNLGVRQPITDDIRYQLLHRAASAVIEAKRFHAPYAIVLIQSFVSNDAENHYDDFCKFVNLFKQKTVKNRLIELSCPHERKLFAAWVQSKPTKKRASI
jgi:hypothetical protein